MCSVWYFVAANQINDPNGLCTFSRQFNGPSIITACQSQNTTQAVKSQKKWPQEKSDRAIDAKRVSRQQVMSLITIVAVLIYVICVFIVSVDKILQIFIGFVVAIVLRVLVVLFRNITFLCVVGVVIVAVIVAL